MQYTNIGRSGLRVSRLCLGTMNFGNLLDEKESHKVMDCAREAGINFFDTADMYGGKAGGGATETIIGNWFAKGGGRREDTVLATKCGNRVNDSRNPNEDRGLSLYKIRRHLKDSLRRLQTDHVEIYETHCVDPKVTWAELMEAYQSLVYEGKMDYFAANSLTAFELAEAQHEAEKRNYFGITYAQNGYSLLNRRLEVEVVSAVKKLGIGLVIFSPQNGGLLSSSVFELHHIVLDEETTAQLKRYHALCSDIGAPPSHVTLAWLLHNPAVTCPIIGVNSIEQVEDNLKALDVMLSDDVLKELDNIFPPLRTYDFRKFFKGFSNIGPVPGAKASK